jgi:hypothetical protein
MELSMQRFQFNILVWMKLSDSEAKMASRWYEGPGWYFNPLDQEGNRLDVRCAGKSEPANYHAGLLESLTHCGTDGWCVAAFFPAESQGVVSNALQTIAGFTANGPYFILQRRAGT